MIATTSAPRDIGTDTRKSAALAALSETTIDVVTAGTLLGIGRNSAYKAREAGDIPSIKVGGQWRVPTAPLKRMLGLEQPAAA